MTSQHTPLENLRTGTQKYHIIETLAGMETPATAAELYAAMDEDTRPPKPDDSSRADADRLTSTLSQLYKDNLIDRTRRTEAKQSPYEYWVAGRGEEWLKMYDDLPEGHTSQPATPAATASAENGESGADVEVWPAVSEWADGLPDEASDYPEPVATLLHQLAEATMEAHRHDHPDPCEDLDTNLAQMAADIETLIAWCESLREDVDEATEMAADAGAEAERATEGAVPDEFSSVLPPLQMLADNGHTLSSVEYEMDGDTATLTIEAENDGA